METKLRSILEEINSEILEHEGEDLIIEGIIDSLDIMMIIEFIEREFDIEIAPDDIVTKNFSSINAMANLIKLKQAES